MRSKRNPIHWSAGTPAIRHVGLSKAPPNYVIPNSWFENLIVDFDLWLVCEGTVELMDSQGKKSLLTRGSAVWLVPGDVYELRVDSSGPYSNFFVHFDMLNSSGKVIPHHQIKTPPTIGHVHDIQYFEATLRRLMFLHYHAKQASANAQESIMSQISCLLKGLLYDYQFAQDSIRTSSGAGIQQHHVQMVSSALSWLYFHSGEGILASDLAKKFGYSQRHFCRIFHQITGKTPGQALIEAKIDHAKKLLATSAMNITEIAESLRYENVFYFSRQFRQVVGVAPFEFRKRLLSTTNDLIPDKEKILHRQYQHPSG